MLRLTALLVFPKSSQHWFLREHSEEQRLCRRWSARIEGVLCTTANLSLLQHFSTIGRRHRCLRQVARGYEEPKGMSRQSLAVVKQGRSNAHVRIRINNERFARTSNNDFGFPTMLNNLRHLVNSVLRAQPTTTSNAASK